MSATSPSPLLTAKDVARYFQVSVRTIRRWQRAGQLPTPLQVGGSLRWRESDLQAWLIRNGANGTSLSVNPVTALED